MNTKFSRFLEAIIEAGWLAALIIVTLTVYLLACIPSSPVHLVSCDQKGAWDLVLMFILAIAGNQSGYSLTKRPKQLPGG